MVVVSLRYALVATLLSIIVFAGLYFFGENPLLQGRFFDFIVIPLFLFFSIKEFKDRKNGGFLQFWQGMTVGFFVYFGLALLFAVFIYIYIQFVDFNVFTDYIQDRIALIQGNKVNLIEQMGEETYYRTLDQMEKVRPLDVAIDDFYKKNLIGFFFATIISVILRKQEFLQKSDIEKA
jgi:hypothetical protein